MSMLIIAAKSISSSVSDESLGSYLSKMDDDVQGFWFRRMPLRFKPCRRFIFFYKCLNGWEIRPALLRSRISFLVPVTIVSMVCPGMLLIAYCSLCPWAKVTEGDIMGITYTWLGGTVTCALALNLAASSASCYFCSFFSSLWIRWTCRASWMFLYLLMLPRD